ncbi:hypothetical protein GGR50DRAFT_33634 [Xylaria sp. CBS 124048]|nr:hypothetical protein GGR50DRAFT_33634 [Xylaria sp. CBS 124048]
MTQRSPSISMSTIQRLDQSKSHLLRLSPDTRTLIFLYLGLPRNSIISLKSDARSHANLSFQPWSLPFSTAFDDIRHFLSSCRTLYEEISYQLLSRNTVVIHDLDRLSRLPPFQVHSLARLKIHLSQTGDCFSHNINQLRSYTFRVLAQQTRVSWYSAWPRKYTQAPDFFGLWDRALENIAIHASLGRLELWLVSDCDIEEIGTVERILAPLSQLRGLKNCHIRLGRRRHSYIEAIARRAAQQTMATSNDDMKRSRARPFRFFDLPPEIRYQILTYTDLVAPHKMILWGSDYGYHIPSSVESCYARAPETDSFHSGCFCSRYHASHSNRCRCWSPPEALFLVSRSFSAEAREVFSGHNRFCVFNGVMPTDSQPPLFPLLNTLASNMVSSLRWLRIDLKGLYRKIQPTGGISGPVGDPWPEAMADFQSHLQLRHLYIQAFFDDDQQGYSELTTSYLQLTHRLVKEGEDKAYAITEVRRFINRHVWPVSDKGSVKGTRRLHVGLGLHTPALEYYVQQQSDPPPMCYGHYDSVDGPKLPYHEFQRPRSGVEGYRLQED